MHRSFYPTVLLTVLVSMVSTSGVSSQSSGSRSQQVAGNMSRSSVMHNIAKGLERPVTVVSPRTGRRMTSTINRIKSILNNAKQQVAQEDSQMDGQFRQNMPFGPFLFVSDEAKKMVEAGSIFTSTAISTGRARIGNRRMALIDARLVQRETCPFNKTISCDAESKFRTIDGSCNNLQNPIWGKASTPFERFLPPDYDDEFNSPRSKSVFRTPLPLPRVISTTVHKRSSVHNLMPDITHLTMEFGQFVSHDINSNAQSKGLNDSALTCCKPDGSPDNSPSKKLLGCLHIDLPTNDPFFGSYDKTCMNFVRAAATSDLECSRGYREQLNQVTSFIDASTVYGSDVNTMDELRLKSDGLLNVTESINGELLLQNPSATGTPACMTSGSQHCFKAGEARANQQPALMTLHTLFLREHNRIARQLKLHNPTWDDERLYQEARKIVGAEVQHITYNEYLPTILGETFANEFGFGSQSAGSYFSGYDITYKPEIRNGFAAAAYRFGHSTVRDHFATGHIFKYHFLKPQVMYEQRKGPSFVLRNLVRDDQQKCDNLMSTQLTNHLLERVPGAGLDLAAINIQRGRDHGLLNYNAWRVWCGLSSAQNFNVAPGGLVDHTANIAALLQSVYSHPSDIDLWTGIVTETPLDYAVIGPTGACIIGRQFWILKHADRFYYENEDTAAKFGIEQLDEIRSISLAKIVCDNTNITILQPNVFRQAASLSNRATDCSKLPGIDLSKWTDCSSAGWSSWSEYSACFSGQRLRSRTCSHQCSQHCQGPSFELSDCSSSDIRFPTWRNNGY